MSTVFCPNCKIELFDHASSYERALKYKKLLEFVTDIASPDVTNSELKSYGLYGWDLEDLITARKLLREIGELDE